MEERYDEALKLPTHSLKSDCSTCWGSNQEMINRIIEQKESIKKVIHVDRKTCYHCLTWQDIEVLESLQAALASLGDFTDSLCAENEITISTFTHFQNQCS